jgi:hypothetical protein
MVRPGSSRVRARQSAPLELAIAFALTGSLLAIAVPIFMHEVHASRLVEPVAGLERLGASAVTYAQEHTPVPGAPAFPPSTPLFPPSPPRGHCEADPPGAWETPTWTALAFRPVPAGSPHCFSFAFDSALSPAKSTFRAHAHGDLDGDGVSSTFEVTGHYVEGDPVGPTLDPGMFVDSEVE